MFPESTGGRRTRIGLTHLINILHPLPPLFQHSSPRSLIFDKYPQTTVTFPASMSDAGSLTIYDKYGRQVAATGSSGSSLEQNPNFSHHARFAVKNGGAKVAFYYSDPEGTTSDMAMAIAHGVAFRK